MRAFYSIILSLVVVAPLLAKDDYKLGPDSVEQPDVPRGKVEQFKFKSQIFPGTERDVWIYTPARLDPKDAACVMVFQDGGAYANSKGDFRVPTVLDNLIHKKEIPVIVGIFINPGVIPAKDD